MCLYEKIGENMYQISANINILYSIKQRIKTSYIENDMLVIYASKLTNNINEENTDYFSYVSFINDIINQLTLLKKMGYFIYGFNANDILYIDGTYFICSELFPFINNTEVRVNHVLNSTEFSPDIRIDVLPALIDYKHAFYSIGLYVLYRMNCNLEDIKHTKLYWFLKRCFLKQCLLYI